MEKATAKVFKKYAPKKALTVLKNYRAKSFDKGMKTTAIKVSRLDLNRTIANIIENASKKEKKLVVSALRNEFREDYADGQTIKY